MTVERIIKVLDSYEPQFPGMAGAETSLSDVLFQFYKGHDFTTAESLALTMNYLKLVAEKLHTEIGQQKDIPFAVNTAGRIPE